MRLVPHARADDRGLGLAVLRHLTLRGARALGIALLSGDPGLVAADPETDTIQTVAAGTVRTLGTNLLPLQVDGEFLGTYARIDLSVDPLALTVLG